MEETKREKVMRQINALLSKADSTDFDAERDAILEKVESLMWAHTIEEWEIEKAKPAAAQQKPEMRTVFVSGPDNPLQQNLIDLTSSISTHTRNKIVYSGAGSKYGDCKAMVFGFPTDLDYFETLYASLHIQLSRKLEPKPSPDLSWVENLVMLKEAGQKWVRIHQLLQVVPDYKYQGRDWERPIGVNFTKVYSAYCKDHERDQLKTSPVTYQRNFAEGYVLEIQNRFWDMRRQAPYSGSMALAVVDRSKETELLMHEVFPKLGSLSRQKNGKFDSAAHRGGRAAGRDADLSAGRGTMKGSTKAIT